MKTEPDRIEPVYFDKILKLYYFNPRMFVIWFKQMKCVIFKSEFHSKSRQVNFYEILKSWKNQLKCDTKLVRISRLRRVNLYYLREFGLIHDETLDGTLVRRFAMHNFSIRNCIPYLWQRASLRTAACFSTTLLSLFHIFFLVRCSWNLFWCLLSRDFLINTF